MCVNVCMRELMVDGMVGMIVMTLLHEIFHGGPDTLALWTDFEVGQSC